MGKKDTVKIKLDEIHWNCGECGNIYSLDVTTCPNNLFDELIVSNVITRKDLDGRR